MLGGMSQGQAKIAPASAHGGMSVPSLSNEMSLAFPITRNALFILRVIQSLSRGSCYKTYDSTLSFPDVFIVEYIFSRM